MAVTIDINANPKGFESGLDSMRAKVNGFATHLGGIGTKIAGAFAAEKVFEKAFEKLQQAADDFKELNAEIARGTALTGASAEQFQKVAFAAKLARVEGGEMEKAILKIRSASADAAKGDPDANEIFSKLQIDPQKFAVADYAEQVLMLADSFATLAKKGDPVKTMLEALGSKNRSLIEFLGQGRDVIAKTMETPGITISDETHDKAEAKRRARETEEQKRIASPATQRIIEAQSTGNKAVNAAADVLASVINFISEGANQTADMLGTNDDPEWYLKKYRENLSANPEDAAYARKKYLELGGKPEALGSNPDAITNPFTAVTNAGNAVAASMGVTVPAADKAAADKKRLTTPIPELFGTASERAGMAERSHEMDFRNSQALQVNLDEKLKSLTGERLRILTAATSEKDPKKAFDLLMKGKGMESEIMSIGKEMNAPDQLTVKAGHIAEMGGGGPVSTFGGVEVKITESTNYLKEIRDRLLGPAGDFFFTPGHIANGEGPNKPAGVYPTARPVSVDNFDKER